MNPNRQQLQQVIYDGDDSVDNVLILKLDGNFELIKGGGDSAVQGVDYVTRWETFDRENDYVGEDASNDNKHLDEIMEWANKAWEKYKKTGETKIIDMWW